MWVRLSAFTALMIAVLVNSAVAAPGDEMYAHPGKLVSAGGTRLNFYCLGSGSPAVVFDSGWEDWSPDWAIVQPRVATWTRACSYDRAGAGYSDAGQMPRTSMQIADELHAALKGAGIDGPIILVGNAFGGVNARVFAARHMAEVAGLVLAEGDTDDLEPTDMQEEDHQGEREYVVQLRDCRDAVAAGKPLPTLPSSPGEPPKTCAQQFFRGLPEKEWSSELNAALLHIAQTKTVMYDSFISEMEQMAADEAYLKEHTISFGSRPIRVISTGNHGVGSLGTPRPSSLKHLRYEYEAALAQSRLLTLSSNAKQIFTKNSSEYIGFDEPDTLIDAIHEVFDQSRPAGASAH